MKKSIWFVAFLIAVIIFGVFVLAGCTRQPSQKESTGASPSSEVSSSVDVPLYCMGYYQRMASGTYENNLVLHPDGTFYYSKMNKAAFTAGRWELIDGEKEYTDADENTQTAVQYFRFTHYDGTVDECAYADDTIWDVQVMGFTSDFTHITDKEWITADEQPVTAVELQLEGDEYSTILLMHNGTYNDTLGDYIEGTWMVDGSTYTLTPDDGSGACTLVVAKDGMGAVYTGVDGTELDLIKPVPSGPVTLMTFDSDRMSLELYNDGTCKLIYAGTTPAAEGTWSYAGYAFTLTLNDTDVPVTMDGETHAFSFEYTLGSGDQSLTQTLTVNSDVWGPLVEQLSAAGT